VFSSVPQPADLEGCPIIHLPDSAEDVSHLLSALYNHQLYVRRQPLSFSVLAAMLRLGSKYDFEHLRGEALFRLRAEFPTTLKEWDNLPRGYTYITERPCLLVDVVNLALEQGLFSILPSAYYVCIEEEQHKVENILKGWARDDGSRAVLFPEARQACIIGRQRILEQLEDTTLSWLDHDGPLDCRDQRKCAKARQSLALSTFKPLLDPYLCLQSWGEVETGALCKACCDYARVKHAQGRSRMWKMMPEIFGFPPWDELKKLDRLQI